MIISRFYALLVNKLLLRSLLRLRLFRGIALCCTGSQKLGIIHAGQGDHVPEQVRVAQEGDGRVVRAHAQHRHGRDLKVKAFSP